MSLDSCKCQQILGADTDTKRLTRRYSLLHTSSALCLAADHPADRHLDCSWPMTCALCSARSDFIVGNVRQVQERVHGRGKEAIRTVGLRIFTSRWAFSPDTAFSPSVVWCLVYSEGFLSLPSKGLEAFQSGTVPGWSHHPTLFPHPLEEGEGRRMQEAQCDRWWRRHGCNAYLPLTHTAVKAPQFTIYRSRQWPGEEDPLTHHLDGTDRWWGWTHLHVTQRIF